MDERNCRPGFAWAFGMRPENFGFDAGTFWGGRGKSRGGPFGGGRMFDQGHLKFVILRLLDEKPRHGYEITDEGRAHLAENQPLIDDIFSRIAEFAQNIFGEPMMEVHRGFKNIGKAIYASKTSTRTPEQIRKIKEILDRAAGEIEGV